MARFRDWIDLAQSTFRSLQVKEVTGLYEMEWPEAKKILIAEQKEAIDSDPKRLRRIARECSAVMYGLAKRLAPQRRVIFFLSQFLLFFSLIDILLNRDETISLWTILFLITASVCVTLLLAMELIDKIKFRDELELARDLQADLIPARLPSMQGFELAAHNRIANTVGGDIYDFVPLPDGRLAVLFGDASGHGMAAGLVMAVAHAAFRTQLDTDPGAPAILSSLNRILCRTGGSRSFFSACYVLLSRDGSYEATLAGHPEIVKVGADGHVVERIGCGSYPLGIKLNMEWKAVTGALAPGEALLFHSDGLTEARNRTGKEFGDIYLETILGWHPGAGARDLVDEIVGEWQAFMGDVVPEDDLSVAVIRRAF